MTESADHTSVEGPEGQEGGVATSGALPPAAGQEQDAPAPPGEMPPGGAGGADETRDASTSAAGGPARCGYTRCRKPLPPPTGRPREFCRETDTSWDVDGRTASCRELARAERLLTAAHGQSPTIAAGERVDLRADLAALREPTEQLRPLLEQATDAVTRADVHVGTVEAQLDERVAAAETDRDEAHRTAAEARGRAAAAEAGQAEAEETQHAAERARDAAQAGEQRARREATEAEHARARADGERDQHAARADELDTRLQAVTEARDTAQRDLAATQARLEATETTLEEARGERDALRAEVDQARGAHQRELDTLRAQHAEKLRELERDHAAALRTADENTAAAAEAARREERAEGEGTRRADAEAHAVQLADLHTRLGAADAHRTEADRARAHAEQQLRTCHRELAAAVAEPGENGQELADRIHRLLAAAEPDEGSE